MSAGFAGIENELFARKNAAAVLGDGKETLSKVVEALAYRKRLV
jgi:NAD/NADP transhydrogenase beta subunit